ncbi:MAG: ferritin-like domain-containing protein [Planctomycetota bacterium]
MNRLSSDEIIQELNRVFAEEVEAAIRYLHLTNAVRGVERLIVEPKLRACFEETIQHAEVIARKIRELGAVPALQLNISLPPESIDAKEAFETALTFEEAALEAYQDLLRRVGGDVPLEEFIRSRIAAESEHVAELKQLLA